MKHKVIEYYQGLTPGGRTIIVLLASGVAIFIGFKIYSGLKNAKAMANSNALASSAENDLKFAINQGIRPNYQNSQYEAWASALQSAFDGCGTDTGTVFSIFEQLQNQADLLKLISTYGTRKYNRCIGWLTGSNSYSLSQAITSELSQNNIDTLNNILDKKNINYKF